MASTDSPFEYLGEIERPGVRAVVNQFRAMHVNGTAVAGEFAVTDDVRGAERWHEDGLEYTGGEFCLGDAFLRSPVVEEFLRTASPESHDEPIGFDGVSVIDDVFANVGAIDGNGRFETVPITRLGSRIAELLTCGGAYEDFEGDHEEAMGLGRAFSHAIRDGRWSRDIEAYVGNVRWSEWFAGSILYCDITVVVVDREAERIRLFLATDTD